MEALAHRDQDLTTGAFRHPPFRKTAYRFGHPADECPVCGSGQMCWVTTESRESHYLCEACGRCWTFETAGVVRVSPVNCPGCGHRETCFERLRMEIPPWSWLPT
jgi:DNA-directed RNA polymerase subunit M/transcription elongation factor TFIIS